MYGPPPFCKRNVKVAVGLHKGIQPSFERFLRDMIKCTLFPFNQSVLRGPFYSIGFQSTGFDPEFISFIASRPGRKSITPHKSLVYRYRNRACDLQSWLQPCVTCGAGQAAFKQVKPEGPELFLLRECGPDDSGQ